MQLKTQEQMDELAKYVRWYGGMETESDAWNWLNKHIPNWMHQHNTKITYEDIITDNSEQKSPSM
jgi:hypothetical protein